MTKQFSTSGKTWWIASIAIWAGNVLGNNWWTNPNMILTRVTAVEAHTTRIQILYRSARWNEDLCHDDDHMIELEAQILGPRITYLHNMLHLVLVFVFVFVFISTIHIMSLFRDVGLLLHLFYFDGQFHPSNGWHTCHNLAHSCPRGWRRLT